MAPYWAILKNVTLQVNLLYHDFGQILGEIGQILGEIGQILIRTSDHTGYKPKE